MVEHGIFVKTCKEGEGLLRGSSWKKTATAILDIEEALITGSSFCS